MKKADELAIIASQIQEEGLKRQDALYQFNNKILNAQPPKAWVKENNRVKYIPIRIGEQLMRSIFGAYEIEIPHPAHIVGNGVVAYARIRYYHPILDKWLTVDGIGAVPIQLKKGTEDRTDITKITAQGIQSVVPAALGFATSNAFKKIGKIFGAELNGDQDYTIDLIDPFRAVKESAVDDLMNEGDE